MQGFVNENISVRGGIWRVPEADELGTAEEGGGRRGNGENEVGQSRWIWRSWMGWRLQSGGGGSVSEGMVEEEKEVDNEDNGRK